MVFQKKLLTDEYRLHIARQFQESITESANSAYYFFLGSHVPRTNTDITYITPDLKTSLYNPYRDMIMGKRISNTDVSLMIRNIPYVANTVYAMYDDTDTNLNEDDFYVSVHVDNGSYYHIFKCLDNNANTRSTVSPDFAHIVGANTILYQTSDGYRWKYMYSISTSVYNKFSTTDFMPVFSNSSVVEQAVEGSIDIIKIEDGGKGYDNYVTGVFNASDLKLNGNPQLYRISNTSASSYDDFYKGCLLYLSTGAGAGAYRRIIAYNGTNRYVTIETPFTSSDLPVEGTAYQVYPEVLIVGDGSQTINAIARAVVNTNSGNSICRIEMFERGLGYDYAAATVAANNVVLVDREAVLRPILPPFNGHGYDPAKELGAKHLAVSVKFSGTESNTILVENNIQQVGIIKDPLFSNVFVHANINHSFGTFQTNETVYKFDTVKICNNVETTILSDVLSSNNGDFENQLSIGDLIYITNGDDNQITEVESITNATSLIMSDPALFTNTISSLHIANVSTNGQVSNVEVNGIYLDNVDGILTIGDCLIGRQSGAYYVAEIIKRSNTAKSFDTFIELYKYKATISSGTFLENEKIYVGANILSQSANASLHSSINISGSNYYVYTSNQIGSFNIGDTIRGANSLTVGVITEKYIPEINFASGDILYIENISPLSRNEDQNEIFKVILEF